MMSRINPCHGLTACKDDQPECLKHRRISQRTRGSPGFQKRLAEFKAARQRLVKAIKQSKTRCYKQLCDEADINPWGTAYRMVMTKLKKKKTPQITCPDVLNRIVQELFPNRPVSASIIVADGQTEVEFPVVLDELNEACIHVCWTEWAKY